MFLQGLSSTYFDSFMLLIIRHIFPYFIIKNATVFNVSSYQRSIGSLNWFRAFTPRLAFIHAMVSYGRVVVGDTSHQFWKCWGLFSTCEGWRGLEGSFGASSVFFWMEISDEMLFKCDSNQKYIKKWKWKYLNSWHYYFQ